MYNLNYTPTTLGGTKMKKKIISGGTRKKKKRLNTTALDHRGGQFWEDFWNGRRILLYNIRDTSQ
jgi:hypothetical protein